MAYHIFVPKDGSFDELRFDRYLGSAVTIDLYWESVGRKLGLEIISTLTLRADSEDGLVLSGDELVKFSRELNAFEKYWNSLIEVIGTPENFMKSIGEIIVAVDEAIADGDSLYVG